MKKNNQGADFENFDLKNIISKRSQTDWPCRADICTVVKTSKEALCPFFKTLAPSKYDDDDDDDDFDDDDGCPFLKTLAPSKYDEENNNYVRDGDDLFYKSCLIKIKSSKEKNWYWLLGL